MTRTLARCTVLVCLGCLAVWGQQIVYSGREYLKTGRSWFQIREVDSVTGRRIQITTSAKDHQKPWCAPDGRSLLFTSGNIGNWRTLSTFNRVTHAESRVIQLEGDLFQITGTVGVNQIAVEEYGGIIEIIDLARKIKVRRLEGVRAAISPDRQFLAWETRTDILASPRQVSHVMLSRLNGADPLDLGEGAAPAFLRDGKTLLFARLDFAEPSVTLVRYDLRTANTQQQITREAEFIFGVSLTVSPDGTTAILGGDTGGHGSGEYWRLSKDFTWVAFDENLDTWGGWSPDGRLVYSTDGHYALRDLDSKRTVWSSDVKVFDSRGNSVRTLVSGISQNADANWCLADVGDVASPQAVH